MLKLIEEETLEIKEKYADPRRTQIVPHSVKGFSMEDLVPNEEALIMVTTDGYIKRLPTDTFKKQSRGGKGVIGLSSKEEEKRKTDKKINKEEKKKYK